ncbi:hypothetical protein HPB51_005244 [Rhipicephalus microplus]|uniref:Uncharacterized protein n=1 Tax=Rhipicephalus microplus TaxID=6941 RepID=A0A9J6DZA8_RHIMP|nr:hypothetical protein HPB51_005244 [Rhipicephalus microplus]
MPNAPIRYYVEPRSCARRGGHDVNKRLKHYDRSALPVEIGEMRADFANMDRDPSQAGRRQRAYSRRQRLLLRVRGTTCCRGRLRGSAPAACYVCSLGGKNAGVPPSLPRRGESSRHSHGVEINSLALQLQTSFTSPFSLPPAADIPGRYNTKKLCFARSVYDVIVDQNNLTYFTVCGKSGSADTIVIDDWQMCTLAPLLQEFGEDNVYNLDEAALFYKMLPMKTFAAKDTTISERKQPKERILSRLLAVTQKEE